jgi:sulfite exporter TauE/SafE
VSLPEGLPLPVAALLMGLLGSVHCAGMCGGIVSAVCARRTADGGQRTADGGPWLRSFAFSSGRVLSYAALGAAFGASGGAFRAALPAAPTVFALRAIAAICMLFVGLQILGLPSVIPHLERLGKPLSRATRPVLARLLAPADRGASLRLLGAGALWSLVPCGMLYATLVLAASSGSTAAGAMVMLCFGAGTSPAMVSLGALVGAFSRWGTWTRRAAGVIVLGFGVVGVGGGFDFVFSASRNEAPCCAPKGEGHAHSGRLDQEHRHLGLGAHR